jgi:hypothetical protein
MRLIIPYVVIAHGQTSLLCSQGSGCALKFTGPLNEVYSVCSLTSRNSCRVQYPDGKPRTNEDLKERYYKVARSLQVAWEGSEEGAANLTLVKHPFNAQHERWAPHPATCSCGSALLHTAHGSFASKLRLREAKAFE